MADDSNKFVGIDRTVRLWSNFPMEKQILKTYTLDIYDEFQKELRKITSYNLREHVDSVYEVYPVQGFVFGYGTRSYFVDVDFPNEIYNCQCCKINRDGILCCHVMKVMSHLGVVHHYSEHYILPRCCKPPPNIVVSDTESREILSGKLPRKETLPKLSGSTTFWRRRYFNVAVGRNRDFALDVLGYSIMGRVSATFFICFVADFRSSAQ